MEALRPHGGVSHASPPRVGNVASHLAEALDIPDTPTPTHWRSRDEMQPMLSDSSVEIMSTDGNESQDTGNLGGPTGPPAGPVRLEARLGNGNPTEDIN